MVMIVRRMRHSTSLAREAPPMSPEPMSTVLTSSPRAGVTLLTLDRPERLNAMNHELVADLHDALDAVKRDRDCRVVVITGAGRGFCSGLDLKGAGEPPNAEGLGRAQAGLTAQQHIATLVPQ